MRGTSSSPHLPRHFPRHEAMQADRTREHDLVLLRDLESGAPSAVVELWRRYGDVAYRAAMLLTGDTVEASDAVVAGFVALRRPPASARSAQLLQCLVAATRQQCAEPGASGNADPVDRAHLRALTDQQLTIIAMVTSQRFRAGDVARLLDVPLPTVHALLREVLATCAVASRVSDAVRDRVSAS